MFIFWQTEARGEKIKRPKSRALVVKKRGKPLVLIGAQLVYSQNARNEKGRKQFVCFPRGMNTNHCIFRPPLFFTPLGLLVYWYSKGIHIGSFREYLYNRGRKENTERMKRSPFLLVFLSLLLLNFSIFESVRRRDFPLKKRKKKKKKKFDLLLLGFERRRLRLHTQEDRERRSVFAHFASLEKEKKDSHKKSDL